jgi:hypothetical protein
MCTVDDIAIVHYTNDCVYQMNRTEGCSRFLTIIVLIRCHHGMGTLQFAVSVLDARVTQGSTLLRAITRCLCGTLLVTMTGTAYT